MTPKASTAWIAGTLTLAVLVGVVVAAWQPVMERWYGGRFADESLPHETRLHAARRLRDLGSPLLMATAVEVMSKYPATPRADEVAATWTVLQELHWPNKQKDFSESHALFSRVVLKRLMQDAEDRERDVANSLLILLGQFGLYSTPEFFAGMQSDDEKVHEQTTGRLMHMLVIWARADGWVDSPPTSEEFAHRLGVGHRDLCRALVMGTKSKSFQARLNCTAMFEKYLIPGAELREMLLSSAHDPFVRERPSRGNQKQQDEVFRSVKTLELRFDVDE